MKSDELSSLLKQIRNLPEDLREHSDGYGVDQYNAKRGKIVTFFRKNGDTLNELLKKKLTLKGNRYFVYQVIERTEKYRAKEYKPTKTQWAADKVFICEAIVKLQLRDQEARVLRTQGIRKKLIPWAVFVLVMAVLIPLISKLYAGRTSSVAAPPVFKSTESVSLDGKLTLNGLPLIHTGVMINNIDSATTDSLGRFNVLMHTYETGRQIPLKITADGLLDTLIVITAPERTRGINLDILKKTVAGKKEVPLPEVGASEPKLVLREYRADLNAVSSDQDGIRFHLDFYALRIKKGLIIISFFDENNRPIMETAGGERTNIPLEIVTEFSTRYGKLSVGNYSKNLFMPFSSFGQAYNNKNIRYSIIMGNITSFQAGIYTYVKRAWTRKGRLKLPNGY